MKTIVILVPSIFFLFYTSKTFSQQTINATLMHDNETREYIVYLPTTYSPGKPAPLLFAFHGMTSNAAWMKTYAEFPQIADTAGFIAVFPQGLKNSYGATHWNIWAPNGGNVDDIGFIDSLIDTLIKTYSIDESRIYSVGHSNGGYFSHMLAMKTDRFAAIASNAGTMSKKMLEGDGPTHPTGILHIHGTLDSAVPYAGSFWSLSADETMNYWILFNKCNNTPEVNDLPDIDTNDNATITQYTYKNNNTQIKVELFKINKGGHSWPGTNVGEYVCNDIHTGKEMWKFVSRFSLKNLATNTNSKSKSKNISIRSNNDILYINGNNLQGLNYNLINFSGNVLSSGLFHSTNNTINLRGLSSGYYILKVENNSYKFAKL